MPTKKQRRRAQKERRHEYETVWVDAEGNELDQPPEEVVAAPAERGDRAKREETKPKAKASQQQRGGRTVRVPPEPSWRRAFKRSAILGAVIFALFYILGSKNGGHNLFGAVEIAVIYTALFVPFTFMIDRFAYNRYQRRVQQQGKSAKKR
jgi:predicted secreted protein